MKRLLIAIILIGFGLTISAEAQTMFYKRSRVGVRAGLPGGIGLDFEQVFKVTKDRLAIHATVGYMPLSYSGLTYADEVGDIDMDIDATGIYYAVGAKYYLLGRQEGLYLGVDYAAQMAEVDLTATSEEAVSLTTTNGVQQFNDVVLNGDYTWSMLMPKLGMNFVSESGFFWGLEVGYGINIGEDNITLDIQNTDEQVNAATGDALGMFGGGFPVVALTIGWGF